MLDQAEKDAIVAGAKTHLIETVFKIVDKARIGKPCTELYENAYNVTAFLQAAEIDSECLTEAEEFRLYDTLTKLAYDQFRITTAPGLGQ
jgi:hypothetical protein